MAKLKKYKKQLTFVYNKTYDYTYLRFKPFRYMEPNILYLYKEAYEEYNWKISTKYVDYSLFRKDKRLFKLGLKEQGLLE